MLRRNTSFAKSGSRLLALALALAISLYPPLPARAAPADEGPLSSLLKRSYLDLFELASKQRISKALIKRERSRLESEKEGEENELEDRKDQIEESIEDAQDGLKDLNKTYHESQRDADRRKELHCRIQSLRKDLQEVKLSLDQGLDTKFDNRFAKLRILKTWPDQYRKLQEDIENGDYVERKFSDFRDIGFRSGEFDDQQDDIKTGREAIEELKRNNLLPPEVEDEQVVGYVRDLAHKIGSHSDLKVPLEVTVLRSEEINAFALPGGFLFINSGLILETDKESELAGVIAHEIGHVTARHGHRLMTRANVAGIIYQAAQVAALVLTGGVASIGTYYALQYGFLGLGLVMNLTLLGVTRDYEIEADILGTQYLWDAGYNTGGFISFFNKMAEKKGYITGLSWFRTHPPFYDRMAQTYSEIVILPEKREAIDDSKDFREVQNRLKSVVEEMKKKDRDAPTLKRVYDCDKAPATSTNN